MNYIYQFLNTNEDVIYVGFTQNIKTRIRSQHFTSGGHLPAECYAEAEMVLYSECLSHDDARIKERYLVNTLQPKFNVSMNNGSRFNFEIDDFKWKYIAVDKSRVHIAPKPRTSREFGEYLKFYQRRRRHPHGTSQDPEEKHLADWAIAFSIENGSIESHCEDLLSKIPDFFTWRGRQATLEQAYVYKRFYEIKNAFPRKIDYSKDNGVSNFEGSLANWYSRSLRNKMNVATPELQKKTPGDINIDRRWGDRLQECKKFVKEFGRLPNKLSSHKDEATLGNWLNQQKYSEHRTFEQATALAQDGFITTDSYSYKLAAQKSRIELGPEQIDQEPAVAIARHEIETYQEVQDAAAGDEEDGSTYERMRG